MANSYKTNPWFIDTTGDLSKSIPTYRDKTHVAYHITKIIVYGASSVAGDELKIKDADGNIKINFIVRHQYGDTMNFSPSIEIKGLNVHTMTHGEALIYVA